ncbi:hypothetical protein SAMN05216316_0922 [Nitrosovibrio sp. Nv6]|nr:hypothetical protein SAMN05216316_0922 [Nitrosovibrio sp. Nv6]
MSNHAPTLVDTLFAVSDIFDFFMRAHCPTPTSLLPGRSRESGNPWGFRLPEFTRCRMTACSSQRLDSRFRGNDEVVVGWVERSATHHPAYFISHQTPHNLAHHFQPDPHRLMRRVVCGFEGLRYAPIMHKCI